MKREKETVEKMNWRCASLVAFLLLSVGSAAIADAPPGIQSGTIPTVNCIYHLLKATRAVQSVDVYAIDEIRSALEYRFKGKDGNDIIADLMLEGPAADVSYDVTIPQNEPQEAGWESTEILSALHVNSKCHVSPAFDSLMPPPSPRPEWRRIDWSNQPPQRLRD